MASAGQPQRLRLSRSASASRTLTAPSGADPDHWITRMASLTRTVPGVETGDLMRYLRLMAITMIAVAVGAVHRSEALDLRLIEGRYKRSFQSEYIGGGKYTASDDLRIVRHGAQAAYFSLGLGFVNGHTCFLDGIAAQRGDELVFRKAILDGRECRMRIVLERGTVKFHDEDRRCQEFSCGARGGYSGVGFRLSLRRPFRNAAALRRSDEFKSAVAAYDALPPETALSRD